MKAYLIARVSTLDQASALPAQIYRLEEYAKQEKYKQTELFKIKESAYGANRESFRQIIDTITEQDELCILVFDKIDRYTRNTNSDEVMLLNRLCRLGKIQLHFPSDNLFINENSSAREIHMLNVGISDAQYFSDSISDNTKRGNQQKWREGKATGPVPFGYVNKRKSDDTKWVYIEPLKAHAIREAFEMYASGNHSVKEITKRWREHYCFRLSSSRIASLLKNPFYCGYMTYNGIEYKHNYKNIIDEELFEKTRVVRESRGKKSVRWLGLPYPYRGLIRCSQCGCRVTFEKKKQKYIYGHCTQFKGRHNAPYVNEESLTATFSQLFKQIQLPDEAYDEISQKLRVEHEAKKKQYTQTMTALENEIKRYTLRLERLYDDYLDGKIEESLHDKKANEAKTSRSIITKRIQNIELYEENEYGTKLHLLKLAHEAPNLFEKANFEQKRSLINKVLSNLFLDAKQLRSEFKYPFDVIAKCNETEMWYPG